MPESPDLRKAREEPCAGGCGCLTSARLGVRPICPACFYGQTCTRPKAARGAREFEVGSVGGCAHCPLDAKYWARNCETGEVVWLCGSHVEGYERAGR